MTTIPNRKLVNGNVGQFLPGDASEILCMDCWFLFILFQPWCNRVDPSGHTSLVINRLLFKPQLDSVCVHDVRLNRIDVLRSIDRSGCCNTLMTLSEHRPIGTVAQGTKFDGQYEGTFIAMFLRKIPGRGQTLMRDSQSQDGSPQALAWSLKTLWLGSS
jgi:hypothetical protein